MKNSLEETAVFIVQAIKQFCFGFDLMNELSESFEDGSAGKAFYLTAIYQYLAIFYLIDRGSNPMGGMFYPALKGHNLEYLLDPIQQLLDSKLGNTTFGEVLRIYRNYAIVHTTYNISDLDRIYREVDMQSPDVQENWQNLLLQLFLETRTLGVRVAEASGVPLSDFGIEEAF